MEHISSLYKEAFDKHGDSPSSVLWPKGRQDDRFNALTREISDKGDFSILDFGCGLAHLKEFADSKFEGIIKYTGVDILPDFLETSARKFPDAAFITPEQLFAEGDRYDYIVASGTFNILYTPEKAAHTQIVFDTLSKLFSKANVYLSVNFMTDQVDFVQEGAYHQNVMELYDFVTSKLSKTFLIDKSYMPYEYTITIWKE